MRLMSRKMMYNHKPVSGRGAALYAGVGPIDGSDPGPESVVFRKMRLLPAKWIRGSSFSIGDGLIKCAILATASDPDDSISFTKPAAWNGRIVYLQVRTWWENCENVHNTNPVRLDFTAGGLIDSKIHGTGSIISTVKEVDGIYAIRVAYYPALDGVQATSLVIRKTSGPGTLADVSVTYDARARAFTIRTAELTNGGSYTFALVAKSGSVELQLDTISFTADAEGPPAVTNLTLTGI